MNERRWPGVWYLLDLEPTRERRGSFVADGMNNVHLATVAGDRIATAGVTIFESRGNSPRVPKWVLHRAQAVGYQITAERRPSLKEHPKR